MRAGAVAGEASGAEAGVDDGGPVRLQGLEPLERPHLQRGGGQVVLQGLPAQGVGAGEKGENPPAVRLQAEAVDVVGREEPVRPGLGPHPLRPLPVEGAGLQGVVHHDPVGVESQAGAAGLVQAVDGEPPLAVLHEGGAVAGEPQEQGPLSTGLPHGGLQAGPAHLEVPVEQGRAPAQIFQEDAGGGEGLPGGPRAALPGEPQQEHGQGGTALLLEKR